MPNESPTGRGYGQGSDSYRADDMARMEREETRIAAAKARAVAVIVPCPYCGNSDFGMDTARCPVHGQTLTWKD